MAKKLIKVVGAALVSGDKILTTKRNSDRILGDLWEFPGGKIEPNETPQAALKRELEEEFDDEIIVGDHIATASYEYDFGIVELSVYFAKLVTKNFELIAHSEVKWRTVDEFDEITWAPADVPIVEAMKKIKIEDVKFDDK